MSAPLQTSASLRHMPHQPSTSPANNAENTKPRNDYNGGDPFAGSAPSSPSPKRSTANKSQRPSSPPSHSREHPSGFQRAKRRSPRSEACSKSPSTAPRCTPFPNPHDNARTSNDSMMRRSSILHSQPPPSNAQHAQYYPPPHHKPIIPTTRQTARDNAPPRNLLPRCSKPDVIDVDCPTTASRTRDYITLAPTQNVRRQSMPSETTNLHASACDPSARHPQTTSDPLPNIRRKGDITISGHAVPSFTFREPRQGVMLISAPRAKPSSWPHAMNSTNKERTSVHAVDSPKHPVRHSTGSQLASRSGTSIAPSAVTRQNTPAKRPRVSQSHQQAADLAVLDIDTAPIPDASLRQNKSSGNSDTGSGMASPNGGPAKKQKRELWMDIQADMAVVNSALKDALEAHPNVLTFSFFGLTDSDLRKLMEPYFPSLPKECSKNMRQINLNNNRLNKLTEFICLSFVRLGVWKLNLACNKLTDIPDNIETCRCLRILDLSSNQLPKVPDSIGNLENLEVLDLSRNAIERLPKGLGKLRKLEIFSLSHNRLIDLPDDIAEEGSQVFALSLCHNLWISTLPECTKHWTLLKTLEVDSTTLRETLSAKDLQLQAVSLVKLIAGRGACELRHRHEHGYFPDKNKTVVEEVDA